ncbi:MAG: hypothetical protein GF329_06120 [Candidatus Lokiarchaeota archaeon]|nr:hypothetical protein [Candidatus Lokiarchaeota archaeon]
MTSKSEEKLTIKKPDPERLRNLYSILGQVLDGLWFLEAEKEMGFDKAFEIDEKVWKIYASKETKRILSILLDRSVRNTDIPKKKVLEILEEILKISLFNQSIQYEINKNEEMATLNFKVVDCKTLKGMKKVGRPLNQAKKICKDIGIAYYENMASTLHPGLRVECVSIPNSYNIDKNPILCEWKFYFI